MKQYTILSIVCGIAVPIALLFLPVLGGGWEKATGLKLLEVDPRYVPMLCKMCLLLAMLCGILIALIRNPTVALVCCIIGLIATLATYAIFNAVNGMGDMFSGAYIALIAFIGAGILNYLQKSAKPQTTQQTT